MTPIARIVVPTDFSAASDAALAYARGLAGQMGASIDLVHVFDDPFTSGAFVGDGTVMMPLDLRQTLEQSAREQLAARHAGHADTLPGSSTVFLMGPPAKRIVSSSLTSNGPAPTKARWPIRRGSAAISSCRSTA